MEKAAHNDENKRVALVTGASGLVGTALISQLLLDDNYETIIALGRRPLEIKHERLRNLTVDLDNLQTESKEWKADDVYCCLGTTIKKAGSQAQFKKVDYEYVMNTAHLAEEARATRFLVVSAVGADPNSRVFYSRTKGEMERDLRLLHLPEIHIFRPSMLLGQRKEFRFGERVGTVLMLLARPLFRGRWAKYHPIAASDVAKAMKLAALKTKEGIHVYEYPQMIGLVNSGSS